jgi:hypothetical protein
MLFLGEAGDAVRSELKLPSGNFVSRVMDELMKSW